MKKYIYFLFAALLFVGCSKDDETSAVDREVVGVWQLVDWNSNQAEDFDVYLELRTDGTFNLFQRVEYSYFEHYWGWFSADGGRLEGRYHDGVTWTYDFAVSDKGYTLTLTDPQSGEVHTYTRGSLPEEALSGSVTRAETSGKRFL